MMTITATTCAHHDTIGGACSRESNTLRYGHHTAHQHACVDNFLDARLRHGLGKRDLVSNINWFMNVPVGADGTLGHRRRDLGARAVRRPARRDGRARADLELPADQQPLQRLRPDAGAARSGTATRVTATEVRRPAPPACPTTADGARCQVLDGGPLTTVQDLPGRVGYWHVGVPPNGPMDDLSHRLVEPRASATPTRAAALELTGAGPTLRFTGPAIDRGRRRDDADDASTADRVAPWTPVAVPAGAVVESAPHDGPGLRATLGVRGGLDAVPVSSAAASTFTLGRFGGHDGRGRSRPATCCRSATDVAGRTRRPRRRAWRPALRHGWAHRRARRPARRARVPDGRRASTPAAHRVGGALQLGPHRRAPGRAQAALGPARRRRGRAAPVEHPRHRLRHRRRRSHGRHARDPRAGRPEPRRLRVPGRGGDRRALEAGPAAPGRPRAPRAVDGRRGRGGAAPAAASGSTAPPPASNRSPGRCGTAARPATRRGRPTPCSRDDAGDRRRGPERHLPPGRRPLPARRVRRR